MKSRKLLVVGIATAAALVPASQSFAQTQSVTGAAVESISLSVPTVAAFGGVLAPGTSPTATGAVTAVSTNPNWILQAKEASGDGKMSRTITDGVCANSAPVLTNAASLAVTPLVANGSITSVTRSLSGSDQTVASASAVPLAATVFNTTYTQVIPAAELLQTLCTYSMTTTYTLAGVA